MRNALRYMGRCVWADWRLWLALVEVMIAVTSRDAWIFAYAGILVAWEVADRMSEITKALREQPKINVWNAGSRAKTARNGRDDVKRATSVRT